MGLTAALSKYTAKRCMALAIAVGACTQAASPGMPPVSAATPSPGPSYSIGVKIDVVLTAPITSETAHVGDSFAFETTRDVKLGDVDVPADSPGQGRLAVVVPAQGKQSGQLSLQIDRIDPPGGPTIWVNIDTTVTPRGHLSNKNNKLLLIPLPIGVVPVFTSKVSGNLILDAGMPFRVVTIAPRTAPAPLLTAPPTPVPVASESPSATTPAPKPT